MTSLTADNKSSIKQKRRFYPGRPTPTPRRRVEAEPSEN
jgi:hypothetical protein